MRKSPTFPPMQCIDCKELTEKHAPNHLRCPECNRLLAIKKAKINRIKNGKEYNCETCGSKFRRVNYKDVFANRFCSKPCHGKSMKKDRLGSGNPSFRTGMYSKLANEKTKRLLLHNCRAFETERAKIIATMMDLYGYRYCQLCLRSDSMRWEVHHIYFRSEKPRHPELHNPKNLIHLCIKCHNYLHAQKNRRDKLVEERGLKELFDHLPHAETPED